MYLVKDGDVEGMRMGLEIDIFTTEEQRVIFGGRMHVILFCRQSFP